MFQQLRNKDFESALQEDENAVLIDVRTASEYEQGHIPNSMNLDIMGADFESQVKSLDPEKNYFMYCRSGARSANACMVLKHLGFRNKIVNLEGGILDWTGEVSLD
jgi:rhodanese-related sulfurtransferase